MPDENGFIDKSLGSVDLWELFYFLKKQFNSETTQ